MGFIRPAGSSDHNHAMPLKIPVVGEYCFLHKLSFVLQNHTARDKYRFSDVCLVHHKKQRGTPTLAKAPE